MISLEPKRMAFFYSFAFLHENNIPSPGNRYRIYNKKFIVTIIVSGML